MKAANQKIFQLKTRLNLKGSMETWTSLCLNLNVLEWKQFQGLHVKTLCSVLPRQGHKESLQHKQYDSDTWTFQRTKSYVSFTSSVITNPIQTFFRVSWGISIRSRDQGEEVNPLFVSPGECWLTPRCLHSLPLSSCLSLGDNWECHPRWGRRWKVRDAQRG